MPQGISEYGANLFLDVILGQWQTTPTTLTVALLLSSPENEDDILDEPDVAAGYARQTFSNSTSGWDQAANGLKFGSGNIFFPTASADWGQITHFALCEPVTGSLILWAELSEPCFVQAGQQFMIEPGMMALAITSPEPGIVV